MSLGALLGETVTSVHKSKDGSFIRFETDRDTFTYYAWGDCCSYTWIEGIDDPKALLGTVMAVENIAMPTESGGFEETDDENNYIQYYGVKITTENGRCVIDYRNRSNGYYGGSLERWDNSLYNRKDSLFKDTIWEQIA